MMMEAAEQRKARAPADALAVGCNQNPAVTLPCCGFTVSLSLCTCHSESWCTSFTITIHVPFPISLPDRSFVRDLPWLLFPKMSSLRMRTMKSLTSGTKSCAFHFGPLRQDFFPENELGRLALTVSSDPTDGQSLPKAQKPPILCSCNFVRRWECHSHLFLVIPSLPVCFKTGSLTLPAIQPKWRCSARRWVLRTAKNMFVRLELWLHPSSRVRSRSSN